MNLRTQLAAAGSPVRVVEIVPPTVATDLHRERPDSDDNKEKHPNTISLEEFMGEISPKLENGDDIIAAGMANGVVKTWYDAYTGPYEPRAAAWK